MKEERQRWSAKRKQEIVVRLLRGASLDPLSRETNQPAGVLSKWRDEFLAGGLAALKSRTRDPKVARLEKELKRAKRLVGDLTMEKELLEMRIERFEGERPFAKRYSYVQRESEKAHAKAWPSSSSQERKYKGSQGT